MSRKVSWGLKEMQNENFVTKKVTQKLGMLGLILALLPLMIPQGVTLSRCNITGGIKIGFAGQVASQRIEACLCAPSLGDTAENSATDQAGANFGRRSCPSCSSSNSSPEGQPLSPAGPRQHDIDQISSPCCSHVLTLDQGILSDQLGTGPRLELAMLESIHILLPHVQLCANEDLFGTSQGIAANHPKDVLRPRGLFKAFPRPLRV